MRKRERTVHNGRSDPSKPRVQRKFLEGAQRLNQQNLDDLNALLEGANKALQTDTAAEACLPKQACQNVRICIFKDVHFQIGG